MPTPAPTVVLRALKPLPADDCGTLLAAIAKLQVGPGQDSFVGEPAAMAAHALSDPQRHPFAITVPGRDGGVVGMGVLHAGAAAETGWPDSGSAILLRGFLVDHRTQRRGYGTAATVAAVELARDLTA